MSPRVPHSDNRGNGYCRTKDREIRKMRQKPVGKRTISGVLGASLGASLCAAFALAQAGVPVDVDAAAATDPHAHHHMGMTSVQRSEASYTAPDVKLVRDDGKTVALPAELDDGRPVILNFIYTSCTTICPVSSQVFEQFQERLGTKHEPVHLVSISIDPEQDTPARLRAYAKQFNAAPGWNHYTGTVAATSAVQWAFNAFRGDKMSHTPLTLVRAAPGKPWIRMDGFASADDLLAERMLWSGDTAAIAAR
jgi:protein SCO1/2